MGQKNVTGQRGHGAENKRVVLVAVSTREYKGEIKPAFLQMESLPTIKKQSVKDFVNKNIADGSHMSTDGYTSYHYLNAEGYSHKHDKILNPKDALKYVPWVHIMIGNVKGIIKGVHHGVSPKHLSGFLAGFCYTKVEGLKTRFCLHVIIPDCFRCFCIQHFLCIRFFNTHKFCMRNLIFIT